MAPITLYLGNKNYSSWSMRAWLAARLSGVDFDEEVFHLSAPGVRERIRRHSPSGRVPALRDGDLVVWDSTAIFEYLAERCPDAALWPADRRARAVARSVTAEMHSGFPELRREMPFNVRRSSPGRGRTPGVLREIERIVAIWAECRATFGGSGSYLFGDWSLADVTYAPVVSRFRTYAVEADATSRDYMAGVWRHPDVERWRADAEAETAVEPQFDL